MVEYKTFKVGDEVSNYSLTVSGYIGGNSAGIFYEELHKINYFWCKAYLISKDNVAYTMHILIRMMGNVPVQPTCPFLLECTVSAYT